MLCTKIYSVFYVICQILYIHKNVSKERIGTHLSIRMFLKLSSDLKGLNLHFLHIINSVTNKSIVDEK